MSYDDFLRQRHFHGLDGLRAIAALMVVAAHFGGWKWAWLSGWSGVHLFFVLSGFLITTLALREEDRRGRVSLRNFYLRRLFRIVPVYLVVVGMYVVFVCAVAQYRGSALAADMPYLLTFLNEYAPNQFVIHSYTLGIEQKFYLVWPLLAFAAGSLPFAGRLGITIAVITAGLVVFVFVQPAPTVHYLVIIFGCLLAVVMHDRRGYRLVRPLTRPGAAVLVVSMFAVVQALLGPVVQHGLLTEPVAILMYGLCAGLVLPATLGPGPVRRALSLTPIRFVGERSYGLYLVQFLVAVTVLRIAPIPQGHRLLIMVAVGALAIADLLHRCVERPFITLGRRIVGDRADGATGTRAGRRL